MSTNYEIFSSLQLTPNQALIWGKNMLESGEPWGLVWDAIKEKFPSTPNEEIDEALNKDVWSVPGTYERYIEANPSAMKLNEAKTALFYHHLQPKFDEAGIENPYKDFDPASVDFTEFEDADEALSIFNNYNDNLNSAVEETDVVPATPLQSTDTTSNSTSTQKDSVSQVTPEFEQFSKDLYNMGEESDTTPSGTPAASDDAIIAMFTIYAGRQPSPNEVKMFRTVDPANQLKMIMDLGAAEKAEKELEESKPGGMGLDTGTNHLIMFSDDPTADVTTGVDTVWIWNSNEHSINGRNYSGSLIPLSSPEAFAKFTGGQMTIEEAKELNMVTTLPTSELTNQQSRFYNARLVKSINGIGDNGKMPLKEAVAYRYGQEIDEVMEERAGNLLFGVFQGLVEDDNDFSQKYYDNAFENPLYQAKYRNALAYGGYEVLDIYMDIMAHNKRAEGDPAFANYTGINSSLNASAWRDSSDDYKQLTSDNPPIKLPDDTNLNWNWTDLKSTLWDMPDEAYSLGVSPTEIDINDPETMAKIEEMKTLTEDLAIQMAEADNEREVAAAKYNWGILKEDIEDQLNVVLSDNAYSAWQQLDTIQSSMSERGVINSGIHNRAMDELMQQRRRADQRYRDDNDAKMDAQTRDYLLNNPGDLAEIDDAMEEYGKDKLREWGIIPDQRTLDFFNMDNLKAMYPDVPEKELQNYIDTMLQTTPGGVVVNTPIQMRNNLVEMYGLEDKQANAKLAKYLAQQGDIMDEKKRDFTEAGKFDDLGREYTEDDKIGQQDASGADPRSNLVPGFSPSRISGEIALKNIFDREIQAGRAAESAVARTTSKNVYNRDLNAERKLIGYYRDNIAGGKAPETEEEWKQFRDFVYEGAIDRPETKVTRDSSTINAAATAAGEMGSTHTKDFDTTKVPSTNQGFTAATPSDEFKTWTQGKNDILGKNWQGYTSISRTEYDTDEKRKKWQNVQNVKGTLYGYKG